MVDTQARPADWLPAEAALRRLGVARQTLYAYVSRGLLRARPDPEDPKRSLYDRFGVEDLVQRRRRGRARRVVAASTIDFGEPVLTSRITQIADGRLWYRGRDAIRLAETATLEDTAALLWDVPSLPVLPPSDEDPAPDGGTTTPIARCLRRIAGLDGTRAESPDQETAAAGSAAAALRAVAEAAGNARADGPLHLVLARAWGVDDAGADLIRRALVLCADHELNASAFAVRVVASTGAALGACLLAGLAALSGPRHGGMTGRVRALLAQPDGAVAEDLRNGAEAPGFGHRLYSDIDPRAAALLAAFPLGPRCAGLFRTMEAVTGLRPNIDAALVALEEHLGLPDGSALALFAAGRTAGWIAHALEQRAAGQLIRPRAVYAGPAPGEGRSGS